ncbi:MAG: hypothetical protein HYZ53_14045 [Planctomycetes bacterium]|nr:hypothetical protein [Planctomycetota bacterium]
MFELIRETQQQARIHAAETGAASAETMARSAQSRYQELAESIDRLSLLTRAMWSLLVEHTELTEQDLIARVKHLDLSDGVADGKVRAQPTECGKCKALISPKFRRCIYCGADRPPPESAFDRV